MSRIIEGFRYESLLDKIPKIPDDIVEWVGNNINLSSMSSYRKGRYDVSRTPFLVDVYRAFADSVTERIVLKLPAQIGKSTCFVNCMLWRFSEKPASVLLGLPTVNDAKNFVENKIEPLISGSERLRSIFPNFESQNKKNARTLSRTVNGVRFLAIGMKASSQRQSHSAPMVFIDEIDNCDMTAITDFIDRTNAFENRKIVLSGTPTIKNHSNVQRFYDISDQRECFVACVKCGFFQVLEWENFITTSRAFPFYKCKKCGFKHYEENKFDLLSNYEWRAKKDFNGIAGFHLNAMYSNFYTWRKLAEDKFRADNDWQFKQNFYNHYMAEVWDREMEGTVIQHEGLMGMREAYPKGVDIPEGAEVLLAGVDIQKNRAEVEFVAYGKNYERWHVEYFVVAGDPTITNLDDERSLWKNLASVLNKKFKNAKGEEVGAECVYIDRGFEGRLVSDFCESFGNGAWFPVWGSTSSRILAPIVRSFSKTVGMIYLSIDTFKFKSEVYKSLSNNLNNGKTHFPIKDCYNKEYFRMLCSEILREVKVGGVLKEKFVVREGYKRNEAFDINWILESCYYAWRIARLQAGHKEAPILE